MIRCGALALLVACSTTPAAVDAGPRTCTFDLSGNRAATGSSASCASITKSDAGDDVLAIDATVAPVGHVRVSIDLGPSAPSGTLSSSDTVRNWTASVTGDDDGGCVLSAGAASVPQGSFTLGSLTVPDAGPPRGVLDVVLAVQAASTIDCGAIDTEYLHVAF